MIGYIFAVFIGFCLGLLGGGGSILFIPVLVYILKIEPKLSIALSLAIVGLTSFIGVFNHYRNNNISFKTIVFFAPFTMLGAYLGSFLASFISGQTQLTLFAMTILGASALMIKDRNKNKNLKPAPQLVFVTSGFIVGIISGVVGVSGGFLIVPSLVLLAGLPMKQAVGTSLAVISLSTLAGFLGYIGQLEIPWDLLIQFVFLSGVGIVAGSHFIQYVSQNKLKKVFAYFLIVMGFFILAQNSFVFFK